MTAPSLHMDASDFVSLADYWRRAPELMRDVLTTAMAAVDMELVAQLKQKLPHGAGGASGLSGSVHAEEQALADNVIGIVGTAIPYAPYVELGTRPHKVGKAGVQSIADWVKVKLGETDPKEALGIAHAIAWKIRHHGTKKQPVWRQVWQDYEPRAQAIFDAAMRNIATRMAEVPT